MGASASSITCFSSYHITLLSLRTVHMDLIMYQTKPDHMAGYKNVVLRPLTATLTYQFALFVTAIPSRRKIPLPLQHTDRPSPWWSTNW